MGVNAKDPSRPGNSMNKFQGKDRAWHIPEDAGCVASLWDLGEGDQHGEGTRAREQFPHRLSHSHTFEICFCCALDFKCSPLSISSSEFQAKNKCISSLKRLLIPVTGSALFLSEAAGLASQWSLCRSPCGCLSARALGKPGRERRCPASVHCVCLALHVGSQC